MKDKLTHRMAFALTRAQFEFLEEMAEKQSSSSAAVLRQAIEKFIVFSRPRVRSF